MCSESELNLLEFGRSKEVPLSSRKEDVATFLFGLLQNHKLEEIMSTDPSMLETNRIERIKKRIEDLVSEAIRLQKAEKYFSLLSTGVASLLLFIEHNMIGPSTHEKHGVFSGDILVLDGEDTIGKLQNPELLLLSRLILLDPLQLQSQMSTDTESIPTLQIGGLEFDLGSHADEESSLFKSVCKKCPSWLWWAGRTAFIHQKCLKHNVSTLRLEMSLLADLLMKQFDHEGSVTKDSYRAMLCLEIAQWELLYRRSQPATEMISKAEDYLKAKIEVSGVLGTRTVHQADLKAQLVAGIHRSEHDLTSSEFGYEIPPWLDDASSEDILLRPQLVNDQGTEQLTVCEQCIAMAKRDLIEVGTGNDELKLWEMEPFTQLLQCQKKTTFPLQAKAALCRSRHERERGRTRERSYALMEILVDRIRNREPSKSHSDLHWSMFCVKFPMIVQLRCELSEFQVSFGEMSAAISTYEELELWDELVLCYCILQKIAIADEIVSKRLKLDSENPRLICTLADLRTSPELYLKAWEVSKRKYPRAQRSLGRIALSKEDYQTAADSFELALSLNMLHPDIWFSLGYCYLKLSQDEDALRAFTRCAQLDAENGEAWNNLAALWMRKNKPERALWALKEAVKYKTKNWETWENYSRASLACQEYSLAIYGLSKVLDFSDGQRLLGEIVAPLVNGLMEKEKNHDNMKIVNKLRDLLTKASLGSAWLSEFWILLGKVHEWNGDANSSIDCLKKCFRQVQGGQWKTDPEKLKLLICVLEELMKSYKKVQVHPGDISSLSLQLKGIIKQAQQSLEETKDLEQLKSLQADINLLQKDLNPI